MSETTECVPPKEEPASDAMRPVSPWGMALPDLELQEDGPMNPGDAHRSTEEEAADSGPSYWGLRSPLPLAIPSAGCALVAYWTSLPAAPFSMIGALPMWILWAAGAVITGAGAMTLLAVGDAGAAIARRLSRGAARPAAELSRPEG